MAPTKSTPPSTASTGNTPPKQAEVNTPAGGTPAKPTQTNEHVKTELEQKIEDEHEVKAIVPQGAPAAPDAVVVAKDEPHLVDIPAGELRPGEVGTVHLDKDGKPIGEAQRHDPTDMSIKTSVRREAAAPEQDIRTPSGAPITSQMNPDPVATMDPAFLARNPPGGDHDSSAAIAADGPTKGYQDAYDKPPVPYDPNDPQRKK